MCALCQNLNKNKHNAEPRVISVLIGLSVFSRS